MDTKTLVAVLVPSILSAAITIANIIYNYLKDKKRKEDKAWDLAEKLTLAAQKESDLFADEAIEQVMYFRIAYRTALLVIDGKEAELQRLCEHSPMTKQLFEAYKSDHLENHSQ